MCAALWTTRLKQGLPGGQPRPSELLDDSPDPNAPAGASSARQVAADVAAARAMSREETGAALAYAACASPFGTIHLAATAAGVCAVSFHETEAEFRARLAPPAWEQPAAAALLATAVAELAEYGAGRRRQFTVPVDLARATPFDRRVLAAIAAIPYGEVRTYGALARDLGSPGAARAVGHACGRNPVPLLIPCHRVVRADGGLGGYGEGGPTIKAALLALEREGHAC